MLLRFQMQTWNLKGKLRPNFQCESPWVVIWASISLSISITTNMKSAYSGSSTCFVNASQTLFYSSGNISPLLHRRMPGLRPKTLGAEKEIDMKSEATFFLDFDRCLPWPFSWISYFPSNHSPEPLPCIYCVIFKHDNSTCIWRWSQKIWK